MSEINLKSENKYDDIKKFLLEHKEYYTEEELRFLLANYTWGEHSLFVSDLLRQIYDELGMIQKENNIYDGFLTLTQNNFDIHQNIIECGGGRIPCLGKRLALANKKGTVTVYDPKLITTTSNIPNLILKKESMTKDTVVKNCQLIVGFMPNEATETIIQFAGKNNIDFIIAFSDGVWEENTYFEDCEEEWQLRMIYEARRQVRENNLGTLEISYLEKYDDPYPVIYNKRNKTVAK